MWWGVGCQSAAEAVVSGAGSVGGWRHSSNHVLSSTPEPGDAS